MAGRSLKELLLAEKALLCRLGELEQEKRDLEVMLETSVKHADYCSLDLEQQRDDLATMLEMATEHADTVEDELHERAAAVVLKSERQLRMVVDATPVAINISSLTDDTIIYANDMMGALFRVPASELIGRKVLEFYYNPSDHLPLVHALHEAKAMNHQEIRFQQLDGTSIWVDMSIRLLEFNNELSILTALHDITERKETEQRLYQQVEELRVELAETSQSSTLAGSTGTTHFHNMDAATIERGTARLIAIHSFRGGNGKSSIAANLAGLLAATGQRVGVVDANIQSPGIHVLLRQSGMKICHTLNDYLLGNCGIEQLALDVTAGLGLPVQGQLFLIPASANPGAMAQILSQGYEAQRLSQSYHELANLLKLDILLIDTHPGINEEALLTMQAVQTLIVVLRPDAQDFDGTGVTVQVARKLKVPHLLFIVNQIPESERLTGVKARVEQTFNAEVGAMLPHSTEFMAFNKGGLFTLRYPDHPLSVALQHMATMVTIEPIRH